MLCRASASVAAAVLVMVASSSAGAQPSAPAGVTGLLDVPYIQQSEALCGGAAAAMVMRYWGETGVYAETFSSLVDRTAGGIRGDALLNSLVERVLADHMVLRAGRGGQNQNRQTDCKRSPNEFHHLILPAMCETHNYCVDRSIIHAAELLSRGMFATFSVQHRLEFLGMNRAPPAPRAARPTPPAPAALEFSSRIS